jgi:HEPN domain-containing protein
MNRSDLKALATIRLNEAASLLKNGHYSGAYYLAGYVVECALKACIAKQTQRYDFPDRRRAQDSWIHSPTKLVQAAGLQTLLDTENSRDSKFAANWNVVKDWSEESRYRNSDQKNAEEIIRAISDRRHGVLRWLRRHW